MARRSIREALQLAKDRMTEGEEVEAAGSMTKYLKGYSEVENKLDSGQEPDRTKQVDTVNKPKFMSNEDAQREMKRRATYSKVR